jgi:hypothetical protein
MFARVATFEGADIDRMRELNQQRMDDGTMNPPPGIKSVLVLADRDAGRHQFISFFDSRDAIAAAEPRFEQMGDEIPEEIRGRRVSVDVYEVMFSMDTSAVETTA